MKLLFLGLFSAMAFLVIAPIAISGVASAQLQDGVNATCPPGGCPGASNPKDSANKLVSMIINIFSWIIGVVSVIMIMVGGFKYITANGDSSKVGSAKNTIVYAIIGLIIVALAQVIVNFVLGTLTLTFA